MGKSASVMLLGLAGSGKSTYLGALLTALESDRSSSVEEGLDLSKDSQLRQALTAPLLRGEYPPRSNTASEVSVQLLFKGQDKGPSSAFWLQALDLPGESIRREFEDRLGHGPWYEPGDAHLLLLLHPERLFQPSKPAPEGLDWEGQWAALGARLEGAKPRKPQGGRRRVKGLQPEDLTPPLQPAERALVRQAGDSVRVPGQLEVIEALQMLRHSKGWPEGWRPPEGRLRVFVLLSHWDAVQKEWSESLGPKRFLKEHVPLLGDFLRSNFRDEDVCVMGLSATGGDLRDGAYSKRYRSEHAQEGRGGYLVEEGADGQLRRHDDLALPIAWLLRGDGVLPIADP